MTSGSANADAIIAQAIEAQGGMDFWNRLEWVDAVISARGFLFKAKHRPVLDRVRMRAWTREPRFAFLDFPRPGQQAELIGDAEVRIMDREGRTLARRETPRSAFRRWGRTLYWDELDFTYFGGYATWNYLVTPFLFARPGFRFRALEPLAGAGGALRRVQVDYPSGIPAHCARQVFYFDETGRLRRFDYTAEVVGGWAHAAQLCSEFRSFQGLTIATRRQVLPCVGGLSPLPGPVLVALEIHDLCPVTKDPGRTEPL